MEKKKELAMRVPNLRVALDYVKGFNPQCVMIIFQGHKLWTCDIDVHVFKSQKYMSNDSR